jgi:hypothetical protein
MVEGIAGVRVLAARLVFVFVFAIDVPWQNSQLRSSALFNARVSSADFG